MVLFEGLPPSCVTSMTLVLKVIRWQFNYKIHFLIVWALPLNYLNHTLIHVRDIIANHRPRFPWIISRNQASHPQTLCARPELVYIISNMY